MKNSDYLHLTKANHTVAMNAKTLKKKADELYKMADISLATSIYLVIYQYIVEEMQRGEVKNSIIYALKQSSENTEDEILIICGSLYIMKNTLKTFGYPGTYDPPAPKEYQSKFCRENYIITNPEKKRKSTSTYSN